MKIKIQGQKHLNSNLYDNIVVGNKQKDIETVLITASTQNPYPNMTKTTTKNIMNIIKDMTEEEKLEEIIDYYLRNNRICYLKEDNGVLARSTSGRRLHIKAYFNKEDFNTTPKISSKILEKYKLDRLLFLDEHEDIKDYRISVSDIVGYEKNRDTIKITLRENNDFSDIVAWEEYFLKSFILEKLYEVNEPAKIKFREKFKYNFGIVCYSPCFKITSGDLIIHLYGISRRLEKEISIMVMNYNYNREEPYKKQLKLEGI